MRLFVPRTPRFRFLPARENASETCDYPALKPFSASPNCTRPRVARGILCLPALKFEEDRRTRFKLQKEITTGESGDGWCYLAYLFGYLCGWRFLFGFLEGTDCWFCWKLDWFRFIFSISFLILALRSGVGLKNEKYLGFWLHSIDLRFTRQGKERRGKVSSHRARIYRFLEYRDRDTSGRSCQSVRSICILETAWSRSIHENSCNRDL